MKYFNYLKWLIIALFFVTGQIFSFAATAYRLEQVTTVKEGGLYVFEQDGYVMNNVITSSKELETTDDYKKTGLTGKESYVWQIEKNKKGYYVIKNVSGNNLYLTNSSSTNLGWDSKESASSWKFHFQEDNTVIIKAHSDGRFLGYKDDSSYLYRAYSEDFLSKEPLRYPHAIVVYQLIDEDAITVASPMFSPAGGTYTDAQDVEISCTTEGASIYYTTDGTAPTESSDLYDSPIRVEETTTIKAIAVKDGIVSMVTTATFTITPISDGEDDEGDEEKTRKNPNLSFDEEVYYVDKNEDDFVAPQLNISEEYDGTILYTSSNGDVATVDSSTGEIKIVGVGTTVITATAEETESFEAAKASYTLEVSEKNGGGKDDKDDEGDKDDEEDNDDDGGDDEGDDFEVVDGVFDFTQGYDYDSKMSKKDDAVNLDSDVKMWTAGCVNLKTYGRVIWYKGEKLKLYIKDQNDIEGTCELSVPNGFAITKIDIEVEGDGAQRLVAESSNGKGALNGSVWTGRAQEVTIKHYNKSGSTGVTITKLSVTYIQTAVRVEIGSSQYITYCCSEYALDFSNVTAYVVPEVTAETVVLTKIEEAPANTPVILNAAEGAYNLEIIESAQDVGNNYLKVSDGAINGNGKIYALASKEGVVGFYLVNNDVAIQEGRCYLEIDDDKIAPSRLVFDFGETNSIMDKNCDDNNSSVFYNLNGQQVTNPTRGIYIWNNRKVLMR